MMTRTLLMLYAEIKAAFIAQGKAEGKTEEQLAKDIILYIRENDEALDAEAVMDEYNKGLMLVS
ncbi:MAG: hypothetical protein K6F52_03255 [Clostridia bacterium]|nr:hypothetical protein [Clostridia bacterium]